MITEFPKSGLTDTQLRASQVPVQTMPSNAQAIRRFGTNSAVGTSYVSIDNVGIATPYMPTTAVRFEALSASANDTSAGSGARTVMITGLDSTWSLTAETVTMNGVTPVASVGTFFRIFKAETMTVGTYGAVNAGNITVRAFGGGSTFAQIDAGNSQSFTSHFTVPAGYYGAITGANLSADSSKIVSVRVLSRDNAQNTTAPFSPVNLTQFYEGMTGVNHFDYDPPIFITPTTDVWITAKVATGTASVSAEYWGWVAPI